MLTRITRSPGAKHRLLVPRCYTLPASPTCVAFLASGVFEFVSSSTVIEILVSEDRKNRVRILSWDYLGAKIQMTWMVTDIAGPAGHPTPESISPRAPGCPAPRDVLFGLAVAFRPQTCFPPPCQEPKLRIARNSRTSEMLVQKLCALFLQRLQMVPLKQWGIHTNSTKLLFLCPGEILKPLLPVL